MMCRAGIVVVSVAQPPYMTRLQPAKGTGKAANRGDELPVIRPELSLVRASETFQDLDPARLSLIRKHG